MAAVEGVLDLWEHYQVSAWRVDIPPDGCRDIIVSLPSSGPHSWTLFALADTTERKVVASDTTLLGARLRPGAILDAKNFLGLARQSTSPPDDVLKRLEEFVRVDSHVEEALALLAQSEIRTGHCARQAGVSERSFQRLVVENTGKTPVFWRQLARARRAAKSLFDTHDMAAVAYENGFSDQAHLSREMRRWFGCSPSTIRQDAQLNAALSQSGYA